MKCEVTLFRCADSCRNNYEDGFHSVICFEKVGEILGETPLRIKITVTNKNPKKKGWRKFSFRSIDLIRFNGTVTPSYLSAYYWVLGNFDECYPGGIFDKPFFFKIEKA